MQSSIEVHMVFDDVQFGIDVRDRRKMAQLTQRQLAAAVGYADGSSISQVECAQDADGLTVRRYMSLCNFLGLNPMHYWDCDPYEMERESWEDRDER